MGRNRFKGKTNPGPSPRLTGAIRVARVLWRGVRPVVVLGLVVGGLAGLGMAAWNAVLRSAYFSIRQIDAEASAHLTREEVIQRAGLEGPVNVFRYETSAGEVSLLAHPWVATASVEKSLPGQVRIRFEERKPEGVVVLGSLYLVDGTGEPFAQPTPAEAAGLPLVTGLDRGIYETDPAQAHIRISEALAVARLYANSPIARRRPLSNVHLGEGGRTELVMGRTRVVLGKERIKQKLGALGRIFAQLEKRKVDASYILMSSDDRRAIVKEVPLPEEQGGSLSLRASPGEPRPPREGAN